MSRERATVIVTKFEQFRDLYTILEPDEHCHGGVKMVGQVHVLRHWKAISKAEYEGTDVAIWLEVDAIKNGQPININDGREMDDMKDAQDIGIGQLISEHMDEFMNSHRWEGYSMEGVQKFRSERDWIEFLEFGGLIVIKQTI